jgi:uncharacterized protein YjiS (DUF1127 family)
MTFIATHTPSAASHSFTARSVSAIGGFFLRYAEARSHHDEIAALELKSDAELAEIGLTRDGIIRHVFPGSFYL